MKLKIIILILFLGPIALYPQDPFFSEGEYLLYEVSYAGLNLGYIKTYYTGCKEEDGVKTHNYKCEVGTYDKIPFIKFKSSILSCISEDLKNFYKYSTNTYTSGSGWFYQEINYRKDSDDWKWSLWKNKKIEEDAVVNHEIDRQDGFSILIFARYNAGSSGTKSVSTIMNGDTTTTFFNFRKSPQKVEINAADYPLKAYYMNGYSTWEGIYGLKGDYEAWFSADEARIPLVANVNVAVGKVRIELKKWSRDNWTPPKFTN
jgi:hypothetical protein